MRNVLTVGIAAALSLTLYGCGGASTSTSAMQGKTLAQQSDISIAGSKPGVTPFISSVQIAGQSVSELKSVTFSIAPMPNTVSQPVSVTWSMSVLSARGYFTGGLINLPVFGLYAGYQNQVGFKLLFDDGSSQQLQYQIATDPYVDSTGIYLSPTIVKARAPGSILGFNFFIMKSQLGSPVIVDTDGQVRWRVPAVASSAVYFANGEFVSGSQTAPTETEIQMDGTQSTPPVGLPQPLLSAFTHNIDPSPNGVLAEFSGTDNLGVSTFDIVAEISPFSNQPPIETFDMADIISTYMKNNGDDPSTFVRPGADWFHVNASAYDPSDNSVIVSSREDFLIKLNYATHEIVWILGDPTKFWYTFPSLRAKALTLNAGGDYPIGQHAITITSDGYLMVFNDGLGSTSQPAGASPGVSRTYSEVSTYTVNPVTMTAQNVWNFDYGQSIFAQLCGSSYEAPGKTYLVDFATADNYKQARLVGLDSNRNVVFDFQYASPTFCGAAWNAIPIPIENLQIN